MSARHAAVAVTADPAATWLALTAGAAEAHPLWGGLAARWGITGSMTVRAAVGLAAVWLLAYAVDRHPSITHRIWTPLTVVFALIAGWNLTVWAGAIV